MRRRAVSIEFDGLLYWYLERFDPAEDRCSFCRELIPDADVPLIIWRGKGYDTAMARLHTSRAAGASWPRGRSAAP
jgi:hypothetical protein